MQSWDNIYKQTGKKYTSSLAYWPKLIKLLERAEVKRVLDVGCGSGKHILSLAREGFEVCGIDSSPEAVNLAKNRFSEAGLKAKILTHSMHNKFPYKDEFFDAAISLRTLNHGFLYQIKKTIAEITRVTKKEGMVFITVIKIPGRKNILGETKLNGVRVRIIEKRTYIPLETKEKGIIHYLFNKKVLYSLFKEKYDIEKMWIEKGKERWERYYCLLGKKR